MPSVIVQSEDFVKAVKAANHVIVGRTTIEVLQYLAISAKDGVAKIQATNLESGVNITMPCTGEGSWALPFDKIASFADACRKAGPLTISGDTMASLRCGAVTARIASMAHSEFPQLVEEPVFTAKPQFESGKFPPMFSRISGVCQDIVGTVFSKAVRLKLAGGKGTIAAVTNYAVARQHFEIQSPSDLDLMVPMEVARAVASIFETGDLWLAAWGSTLWLRNETCAFYTKTLDCSHPLDVDDLICEDEGANLTDMDSVVAAAKAAVSMSPMKMQRILLNCQPGEVFAAGINGGQAFCVPFDSNVQSPFQMMTGEVQLRSVAAAHGKETAGLLMKNMNNIIRRPHLQITVPGFMGIVMPMMSTADEVSVALEAFRHGQVEAAAA